MGSQEALSNRIRRVSFPERKPLENELDANCFGKQLKHRKLRVEREFLMLASHETHGVTGAGSLEPDAKKNIAVTVVDPVT